MAAAASNGWHCHAASGRHTAACPEQQQQQQQVGATKQAPEPAGPAVRPDPKQQQAVAGALMQPAALNMLQPAQDQQKTAAVPSPCTQAPAGPAEQPWTPDQLLQDMSALLPSLSQEHSLAAAQAASQEMCESLGLPANLPVDVPPVLVCLS